MKPINKTITKTVWIDKEVEVDIDLADLFDLADSDNFVGLLEACYEVLGEFQNPSAPIGTPAYEAFTLHWQIREMLEK